MKTLHLTLKKKWFDMIACGEKKEEYRDLKKYWIRRLIIDLECCEYYSWGGMERVIKDQEKCDVTYSFDEFDTVIFRNGYAKDAPTITVQCLGISIGPAKPEWSDNWQGKVFIIKLGEVLP
ncbi:hypothetical protein [Pedobacter antarcticus]|uniref:hypothetical protein n=1 Tax=Pedobacter antarcticus TaxID=34086 RepID=UPI002930707A|nr:hypothetical protein [Pedobacter antarcticus]